MRSGEWFELQNFLDDQARRVGRLFVEWLAKVLSKRAFRRGRGFLD